MNNTPVIHVEHLHKTYGDFTAVEDVSFEVHAGEIFGIIGPNGAGKTTITEMIEGLRQPDRGTVRVLGLDPRAQGNQLRQRIGIQLQQAVLPEKIKVWEALDLFASFYRRTTDWRALLDQWHLSEKRNATFGSLSGGQKQRLFIALALVNDPDVVFLDELTTGLDPQARRETWDHVRAIRERGKSVVLVTHFMDEAERLCDRIGLIDHGQIAALDTPLNLVQGLSAENRVRFRLNHGFDPSLLQAVRGVSRVTRDGDEIVVYGTGPLMAHVAATLAEHDLAPADLRAEQPNLEDVFLALTGHAIRN
jgi:ABC-2 type transport system ATP-binding protein